MYWVSRSPCSCSGGEGASIEDLFALRSTVEMPKEPHLRSPPLYEAFVSSRVKWNRLSQRSILAMISAPVSRCGKDLHGARPIALLLPFPSPKSGHIVREYRD